jgi:hypothetical protein
MLSSRTKLTSSSWLSPFDTEDISECIIKTQVADPNIYDRMSPTVVVLNADIIWLVLQHAAYTDDVWDHRTLRECCRVSREWYPLAKRILFRYIVLRNRRQVRALQQTRGKHLQTGPNDPPGGLGYDVPVPVDTWKAHTRILECHWWDYFRFNDIRHALALFPSLYEVRVSVHFYERHQGNRDDSALAIPSTIRALRYTSLLLSGPLNVACASRIISVLSKHARLHSLQFEGVSITPHLQFPRLFQSTPVNALLYLELEICDLPEALSGDLFANLLYLVLHQKSRCIQGAILQPGVFKRVKSLTVLYSSRMESLETVLQLSELSKTFPELTEFRLGVRLHRLRLSTIAPLLSQIPSGLISLSLFIEANPPTDTELAETQPSDSFTIPTTFRYFEYALGYYPGTHASDDPPVIRPFLDSCKSKGVRLLPSRLYDMAEIVSILIFPYYLLIYL